MTQGLRTTIAFQTRSEPAGDFTFAGKSSAYCFDFRNLIQCFPRNRKVDYQFGDVTEIPNEPRFVKSRPVRRDASNRNSVLLKLNSVRHYQFVVSVEGIDVATNLKWIMASNSLCLMRRPRFETWFMEGSLVPGYHYVELADDHSDLPEKVRYYQNHPEQAEAIIANANRYVEKFFDQQMEQTIALLVIQKYLHLSGQEVYDLPRLKAG